MANTISGSLFFERAGVQELYQALKQETVHIPNCFRIFLTLNQDTQLSAYNHLLSLEGRTVAPTATIREGLKLFIKNPQKLLAKNPSNGRSFIDVMLDIVQQSDPAPTSSSTQEERVAARTHTIRRCIGRVIAIHPRSF